MHSRTTRRRSSRSRRGASVLEVTIAIALMGLAMGAVATTGDSMKSAYRTADAVSVGDQRARTAIRRIDEILAVADASSVTPRIEAPFSSTWIEFDTIAGFEGATAVAGDTQRLELRYSPGELDNGVDDDGNGLVDECQLVWIRNVGQPDESESTICTSLSEYLGGETLDGADENGNGLADERGFCIEDDGGLLRVRLTVEIRTAKGLRVLRSVERTTALRMGT